MESLGETELESETEELGVDDLESVRVADFESVALGVALEVCEFVSV